MELTNANYFSPEANREYLSSTQFKAFQRCEAAALAELEGRYERPKTTALLVGSYIDAYFEGTLDDFKAREPGLFKKDGTLKSDFVQANQIIGRLERDELYMLLMSGRKQVVMAGEIGGLPYKVKIDSLLDADTCKKIVAKFPQTGTALGFLDGAIVDQKILKDTADVWTGGEWTSFVEAWGYDIQGAIYQAVEGHMLPFILAVGTKESEPDLAAVYIPDQELAAALEVVKALSPRYQAIKRHELEPVGCGHCPYCRSRKKLTTIIDFREVGR